PARAATVGVVVLALAGILPLVSAVATIMGTGALLIAAWRTLRSGEQPVAGQADGAVGPAGSTGPAGSVDPGWAQPLPTAG
ncbi:MAG: hypothetical protein WCK58_14365, partial [Chloroflexota bacterium]